MSNVLQEVLHQEYVRKLNEQITLLKRIVEIHEETNIIQKQRIEQLESDLEKSMKQSEELLALANKAIDEAKSNW